MTSSRDEDRAEIIAAESDGQKATRREAGSRGWQENSFCARGQSVSREEKDSRIGSGGGQDAVAADPEPGSRQAPRVVAVPDLGGRKGTEDTQVGENTGT